jgi:hypothetical protein
MNPMSAWRSTLFVLGGLILAFLLAEAGLRLWYPAAEFAVRFGGADMQSHKIAHPFFPFAGRPNHSYRQYRAELGDFIQIGLNSYGFRTSEFPEEKQPGDYFILCLGESTTWGYIAESNETTWPALLEKRLRDKYRGRNVRVFNLGIESGSLPYSVIVLAIIGTHLRPDLVITYHGFNDYGPLTAASFKTDYSHHYIDVHPQRLSHGLRRRMPDWMLSSYAATILADLIDRARGINTLAREGQRDLTPGSSDPALVASRIKPHLRTIDAVSRGRGGRALFSTFQFFDGESEQARVMNKALRDVFEGNRFEYVDQDRLIPDGDRMLQIDACHFTRKGRELVAQNFFDHIVERGWIEAAATTSDRR